MKITVNWLKEFVDFDISAQELAQKLTSAGMEVEEIIYQNEHLHHVVVGKILKIEKHPEADRLQICKVDIGNETTQIITSATNIFEGAVVPVSLPGADLCNGVKIEKSKFRGVESCGMFCSGEEIGIDENYFEGAGINGILILSDDMKIGQPIEEALCLNDIVLDVGITPNRPDCMSVIGLAREVCAILGKKMKTVDLSYKEVGEKVSDYVNVKVETENCPRYMAAVVKDLKVERSPLWMRSKLFAVGIKPINTIVDITNYVLIEMGQPLHAFDQKLIGEGQIVVRQAKTGESIEALNHNEYELDESIMVISDAKKPMVIAGIIGGMNSCINADSNVAVFESAVFDLKSIRITSKRIGVRTDSAARYCKGVNVDSAELGIKRALHLVCKLGCGKVISGIIDKATKENKPRKIEASVKEIIKILGVEIPKARIEEILNCLGIETTIDGDKISCIVPPYREDIERDCDLAEEVIRLYGYDVYDNLDYSLFENVKMTEGRFDPKLALERQMKQVLVDKGFFECVNFSICPPDICKKLLINDERQNMIKITNPISEDISCVRTCMAHASLVNIAYNQSVGNKNIKLFEVGRVYLPKSLPLEDYAKEEDYLSCVVSADAFDFFKLKGIVESLLAKTSLKYSIKRSEENYLHPGISADVLSESGEKIASFGQIHPQVAKNYDIAGKVFYAEINIEKLYALPPKKFSVKPVPKYPIVERDLAIVASEEVAAGDLLAAIKSASGKLFYDVSLFDIYRSAQLGEGKKSLAFNIKLSDEKKTLSDEEVSAVMNKIVKSLRFRFNAEIRQ